jgi:hypothetical protein
MTRARETLIDLNRASYYHCIDPCVRRAFLCGEDHLTGKNYEHRKAWVTEPLDYNTDDIGGRIVFPLTTFTWPSGATPVSALCINCSFVTSPPCRAIKCAFGWLVTRSRCCVLILFGTKHHYDAISKNL